MCCMAENMHVFEANRFLPPDRHGKTPGIKTVTLDAVVTTTQLMSVKSAAGYV